LIVEIGGDKSGRGATDGGSHGKRAPHCSQCERSSELAALHRAQNPKPSGVLISGNSTQRNHKGHKEFLKMTMKALPCAKLSFPFVFFVNPLCTLRLKNFIPTSRF
jgi:hypothetical protein